MKVVFLDVDGPMVSGRCYANNKRPKVLGEYAFDPLAVDLLNRLTDKAGARIVVSSTWARLGYEAMRRILEANGIRGELHQDWTCRDDQFDSRTAQIRAWLAVHPEVTHWVSLDDCPIQLDGAVLVDADDGLSMQNYRDATVRLGCADRFLVLI